MPIYIGILIGIFALLYSGRTIATRQELATVNYDIIFQQAQTKHKVNWKLLKAVAMAESSLNHLAVNANDPSVGLMQILCQGWPNECRNKFPAIPNWPPKYPQELLNAEYNVDIGAQILKANITSYGFPRGLAAYNAWDQRNSPATGPFKNQGYVDKILATYKKLGGLEKEVLVNG